MILKLGAVTALAFAKSCIALPGGQKSAIKWVDCASNIPEPLQNTSLPSVLPSTLHCGTLDVPMDYTKPATANNTITLGFAMNRPKNPKGLLNFNSGGPNDEVRSFAWMFALNISMADWFYGLEEFDFLAMDVRGTFSSNPLNCTLGDFYISSSLPSTEAEFTAYQKMAGTFAQSCIDKSTPKGIVAHMSTADTAQDWDSLRAALGYDKMNLLGYSYGTFGGAAYVDKFPHHVGRFVMDAILAHGLSNLEFVVAQVAAANRLLLRADAYCIYDPNCPFHSQGKGSVVKAFNTVLQRTVSDSGNITADDVRASTYIGFMLGSPNFPGFHQALNGALNGNWSGFSYSQIGPLFSAGTSAVIPTACLDIHIENNTFAAYDQLRKTAAKADTADIEFVLDFVVLGLCGGWPYRAKSNDKVPINEAMLLVTADFDANAPTEFSTFEWTQAPRSSLLVRHGDDHGTFIVQGPARLVEVNFLNTGVLPSAQNETLYTVYSPGSKRGPIANPYTAPIGPSAGDSS